MSTNFSYHESEFFDYAIESELGILENLVKNDNVTDILVNGHSQIWVDKGKGLEKTNLTFISEENLRNFAQKLALANNKRLDQSSPYVDILLENNIRMHAILSPLANPGTIISLRVHREKVYTLLDLVNLKTIKKLQKEFLEELILKQKSFVISGGTGSGKTTLLNSLLSLVPLNQRIIIVEDSKELKPDHPHVISLSARSPNIEGKGEITLRDLIKQTLRMRADRLVVGEVRGNEVIDWLAALNTGHKGGCGTIHANSIYEVVSRFENLGLNAGFSLTAIHAQLKNTIQYVIQLDQDLQGQREIKDIGELFINDQGVNEVRPLKI